MIANRDNNYAARLSASKKPTASGWSQRDRALINMIRQLPAEDEEFPINRRLIWLGAVAVIIAACAKEDGHPLDVIDIRAKQEVKALIEREGGENG